MGEDHTPYERRRVTVAEAAEVLGISAEAVRMRLRRGTLNSERHEGTIYVLLDTDQTRHVADASTDRTDLLIAILQEQLAAERQAHAEARRLLAAALERTPPQLEAPQEASEAPQTASEEAERVEPLTDPGRPQLSSILMVLSWIGVGSIPIWAPEVRYYASFAPLAILLALFSLFVLPFVLPFIFGLYRGVWLRKRREFDQTTGSSQQDEFVGTVGFRESKVALATGGGTAFVTIFLSTLTGHGFEVELAFVTFVGSFLFFVFAVLIGSATGGQEGRHDTSRSQTRGGGLRAAAWWNPQLILGLLATIITAAATVFAASLAG